jgi:hypothetical protein
VYLIRVSLCYLIQCETHLEAVAIGEGAVTFAVIVETVSEVEAGGLSTEVVASKAFRYIRKTSQGYTLTLH